ncbi:hypothetical protein EMIT0111MI5_300027 [Burkholderia sp. IT-111MI5]
MNSTSNARSLAASAPTSFASVTSSRRVVSRPPARSASAASRASAASLMSVASTSAPSLANRSAVARPMPCPAAVTSARLPCNLMSASPGKAGHQSADWHKGLKVQPMIGSDRPFVTNLGFSIYPSGQIRRVDKNAALDRPWQRARGFAQTQCRQASQPVFRARPARLPRQTGKKVMFASGSQRDARAIMALPDRASGTSPPRPRSIPAGTPSPGDVSRDWASRHGARADFPPRTFRPGRFCPWIPRKMSVDCF